MMAVLYSPIPPSSPALVEGWTDGAARRPIGKDHEATCPSTPYISSRRPGNEDTPTVTDWYIADCVTILSNPSLELTNEKQDDVMPQCSHWPI